MQRSGRRGEEEEKAVKRGIVGWGWWGGWEAGGRGKQYSNKSREKEEKKCRLAAISPRQLTIKATFKGINQSSTKHSLRKGSYRAEKKKTQQEKQAERSVCAAKPRKKAQLVCLSPPGVVCMRRLKPAHLP